MAYNENKEQIFVSIITVCFNSVETIQRTIESVLNQTYDCYEYIVVDGGSTDRTLDIIEEYRAKFQGKLYVISEKDDGIYDAMNKGIRHAKGKLIGLINSDDYYEQNALEKVVKAYTGRDLEIIYGMEREYANNGRLRDIVFYSHEFLKEQMINHPTCFVTKNTYEEIGYYDLQYKSSSDYDFLLRCFLSKKVLFTPVYDIISNFYLEGVSSKVEAHLETFKIWKKYGCISNKRYYLITLRTKLKKWIG